MHGTLAHDGAAHRQLQQLPKPQRPHAVWKAKAATQVMPSVMHCNRLLAALIWAQDWVGCMLHHVGAWQHDTMHMSRPWPLLNRQMTQHNISTHSGCSLNAAETASQCCMCGS